MKILVVGSGGREHALAWKLAQSERVTELYIAPGNPGTAALAGSRAGLKVENIAIKSDDVAGLLNFARKEAIDLTVVGPEIPLVMGIVDDFEKAGLRAWGPSKAASELEGSKVAMKEFLRRYNIPTAAFKIFDDAAEAHEYIEEVGAPIVIKCDGLAAGKGVTVAQTEDEAHDAVTRMMENHQFGKEAGSHLIIEEILEGEEISVFAFCDGHNALILDTAQDHKQVFDGDRGPNTGGMGAFTPAPGLMSEADEDVVVSRILLPTLSGLVKEGRPYVGILYMGLMLTNKGPRVIEYNVRFGDPECQPLMLRLQNDLVDICEACIDGKLDTITLDWSDDTAICVTLASGGYPGSYENGKAITAVEEAAAEKGVTVFHAGTSKKNGVLYTAGGRVLSVCAQGEDLTAAREVAYAASEAITFDGKHYRNDIGCRTEAR